MSIRRIYVEQSDIWGARSVDGFGGKSIKEVCGCMKTLHPVCSKERSLEERANDVVGRANDPFNFTILGRGIGTGHAKDGALSEEERAHGGVIEFSPIVTLNYFHSATKHRKKRK